MNVKQISVFLENKPGKLAAMTALLSENEINIRALSLADTNDFGIVRMIVSDSMKALEVLADAGFTVKVTPVVAVAVPDQPGSLAKILLLFSQNDINVEYMYGFVSKGGDGASMVFRVEDADAARETLLASGLTVIADDEVGNI